jgi:hypothetical protein
MGRLFSLDKVTLSARCKRIQKDHVMSRLFDGCMALPLLHEGLSRPNALLSKLRTNPDSENGRDLSLAFGSVQLGGFFWNLTSLILHESGKLLLAF